ncbi:MAG: hypothetical protein JST54_00190 [Deltaproteobacteria bacterium]|nr:hypothetical protein [Deltaproteobacteria bacterium]
MRRRHRVHHSGPAAKPGGRSARAHTGTAQGAPAQQVLDFSLGVRTDLLRLRSAGADVRIAYSPLDAVQLARENPRREVVFFGISFATRQKLGVEIDEHLVPVADAVRGACELLGMDPMLIANEGKLVAFVPPEGAGAVLEAMRAHPLGRAAARLGVVTAEHPWTVAVRTLVGGRRVLDLPFGEVLPRIC